MLHFIGIRGVVTSILISAAIFTISYFFETPNSCIQPGPWGTPGAKSVTTTVVPCVLSLIACLLFSSPMLKTGKTYDPNRRSVADVTAI
ncbi:MAG: hypothetical protein QOK38_800 [Acidobacteriaceae bacterium]|nr:hypothetical protein [Acidobacteriaceae bacterium]